MIAKRSIAALLASAITAGYASDARAVDFLSDDELKSTMTGLIIDFFRNGKTVRWTYPANGNFREVTYHTPKDLELTASGKWSIEGRTLVCVQDRRPDQEKVCYKYAYVDGILRQYTWYGVQTRDPMHVVGR